MSASSRLKELRFDPLPALLSREDPALTYFIRRDLLDEAVGPVKALWNLPVARRSLGTQQSGGSWRYPARKQGTLNGGNYGLLETFRLWLRAQRGALAYMGRAGHLQDIEAFSGLRPVNHAPEKSQELPRNNPSMSCTSFKYFLRTTSTPWANFLLHPGAVLS